MFNKNFEIKGRTKFGILADDIVEIPNTYNSGKFWNTGVMRYGHFYSADTIPLGDEEPMTLGEILVDEDTVDEKYYLTAKQVEKFEYLRGAKRIERTSSNGHQYIYSEGGMSPYDSLDLPGRTMLTSEGSVNRSTHIVKVNDKLRFLTPIEAERLQDFPDDWTKYKQLSDGTVEEVTDRKRMFFMGNALVTGIVERIGIQLKEIALVNSK